MPDKGGIGMISLELSKKLKEAGLEWEPKLGDHYIIPAVFEVGLHEVMDTKQIMSYHKNPKEWEESIRGFVFAPRLEQLLAKIRELGYKWFVETDTERYFIRVVEIKKPNNSHVIFSDSPANAAASALLWIYEGRAKA